MASTSLRDRTQHLVSELNKRMTYREIAAACELSEAWVESFAQGRIAGPSVVKVETLYVFVTKRQLELA